jgi:hypothetical protein
LDQKKPQYQVLGGIKYRQIHYYLIDWFQKTHHFLNMLVLHCASLGTHWWKKIFLDNWLVSDGGFLIFDTPYWDWINLQSDPNLLENWDCIEWSDPNTWYWGLFWSNTQWINGPQPLGIGLGL